MKTFPAIISASLEHGYRARSRVKEKILSCREQVNTMLSRKLAAAACRW